jgi:hypothetical protein
MGKRKLQSLLLVSIFVGCNPISVPPSSSQIRKLTHEVLPATHSDVALTERLRAAGFDDLNAVQSFLDNLKGVVHGQDRRTLLGMIRFPFTRYNNGIPSRRYDSAAELSHDFDRIFTSQVSVAIKTASLKALFVNYQGAMLGNGEIWFDCREDGIKIKAIN